MRYIDPAPARPSSALGLETSVRARGRGIIILSGPSSCGKGAIASQLRKTLHLPPENHISMGEALRETIRRAREDDAFLEVLPENFGIFPDRCIYDEEFSDEGLISKAESYKDELSDRYGSEPSQLDWLEYCVGAGLLVPDAWSEAIIEGVIAERASKHESVILLDGYPRTEIAAQHVLSLSQRLNIPIIRVIHLSVAKKEMHRRALGRQRMDDSPELLERRYQFYIDQVQPSLEFLKARLGSRKVALIDAHQPEYRGGGELDLEASVRNVANSVLMALGVSRHILENLTDDDKGKSDDSAATATLRTEDTLGGSAQDPEVEP
ncbi:MAG: nucleoside monophosphate kinase [Myxococcota bacterium]|nr:nucleoside monophosphate kinase [Myxococcota bacterium]